MKLSEIKNLSQNQLPSFSTSMGAELADQLHTMGLDPGCFYQELEMDSPFVDTHRDLSYSNANIHFHSHAFYEILCCQNSCGAEYLVNSDRYKLQKGDIIFVPPGVSHRPLLPEVVLQPYARDVMWISESYMTAIQPLFSGDLIKQFSQPGLFRTAGTRWEYICELFHQGVLEAESGLACWQPIICANALNILSHLGRAASDIHTNPMKAEEPELLEQVLSYIELHLSERLTLGDIAHHFFVSESTITQTFRKKIGVSFYRCVTQRRLIAAKALIERGITMESVAESVGFSDYSSFFRAFKQEFGISPRQYRKMHLNG